MASVKWGMVCSVPDSCCEEKLRKFGHWLVENLACGVRRLRLQLKFSKEPSFVRHCEPGNRDQLFNAYCHINEQFGDVLYVVHIFPHKDSCEFTWVRNELSSRYALVVQGVLLERVMDRFAGLTASGGDLGAVFDSMCQWMQRRLSQLVCFKRPETAYKLTVVRPNDSCVSGDGILSEKPSDSAVGPLDYHTNEEGGNDDCRVRVSGFPSHYNDFQLASLFCDGFQPVRVELTPSTGGGSDGRLHEATIQFKNRYHSMQVIVLYHENSFESFGGEPAEDFTLRVVSCSPTVQKKASALWNRLLQKRNELEVGESI